MRLLSVLVAAALALFAPLVTTACATMPTATTIATARAYVTKVEPYWVAIKATATAWLPHLSPANAARVTSALAIGDQAMADAQAALTLADAVTAVSKATGAAAEVRAAVAAN